jgi:hypothetical protein
MPRIRSLKPEHRQHRKVGPLSDREYRLWVGMICEADDQGRLVADPRQLRVLIFGYQQITDDDVEEAIQKLTKVGLIDLYEVDKVRYANFPSWHDHQRINRPTPSKLPAQSASVSGQGSLDESSVTPHRGLTEHSVMTHAGSERKGWEGRETALSAVAELPLNDVVTPNGHGPKPSAQGRVVALTSEEFIALFNAQMPPEIRRVTKVTEARRKKIQAALHQLPDREAWERIAAEVTASLFLRGLRPSPGHEHWRCDVDWLLGRGKGSGSENFIRVFEGHYRDRRNHADEEDDE